MINVEDHLGLARLIAHKYYNVVKSKYSYDEIESTAYMGLIRAANNFDESKGFKFSSYAIPTIAGEIKRMIRDDKWYFPKRFTPNTIISLNVIIEDTNGIEMQDTLEDECSTEENLVNSIFVSELFNLLTDHEREVMYLYFYKDKTQCDIAKIENISQVQVSRVINRSLKKMKAIMLNNIAI